MTDNPDRIQRHDGRASRARKKKRTEISCVGFQQSVERRDNLGSGNVTLNSGDSRFRRFQHGEIGREFRFRRVTSG